MKTKRTEVMTSLAIKMISQVVAGKENVNAAFIGDFLEWQMGTEVTLSELVEVMYGIKHRGE